MATTATKEYYYEQFRKTYPYISVAREVIYDFIENRPEMITRYTEERLLDLMQDYVCSQMLYDEIQL